MAAKFDDFINAVLEGAKDLAKDIFDGFEDQAKEDARDFANKAEADLRRWVKLLADEKITKKDFRDLVEAKEALAEIHALTVAGIAATKLERFRSGLLDLVVNSAIKTFL
jgi:hypothetical protein